VIKGSEICKFRKKCILKIYILQSGVNYTCQLNFNMPVLTTDTTPALLGNRGVAAMIKKMEMNKGTMILTFHCIVHQENMGAKSFPGFQHVMTVATKVVNFKS
jgi:hypothetical protein